MFSLRTCTVSKSLNVKALAVVHVPYISFCFCWFVIKDMTKCLVSRDFFFVFVCGLGREEALLILVCYSDSLWDNAAVTLRYSFNKLHTFISNFFVYFPFFVPILFNTFNKLLFDLWRRIEVSNLRCSECFNVYLNFSE